MHEFPDTGTKLIFTGSNPIPVEFFQNRVLNRPELRTTHEEADVIIVQRMVHLASKVDSIKVVCDDTDVFVLLMYFYVTEKLACNVYMENTSAPKVVIDIRASVDNNKVLICNLPAAHALSGCDTTSSLFGIGKTTIVKVLKSGPSLSSLGNIVSDIDIVLEESSRFICQCYMFGSVNGGTMSDFRYQIWTHKMARKNITSAPELKSIPPTSEAFKQHVLRAHNQTIIWKSALLQDPPQLERAEFGWVKDSSNEFVPLMVPHGIEAAPDSVLKLIRCGCCSSLPCKSPRCTCFVAKLSCSVFCSCAGSDDCCNECTKQKMLLIMTQILKMK